MEPCRQSPIPAHSSVPRTLSSTRRSTAVRQPPILSSPRMSHWPGARRSGSNYDATAETVRGAPQDAGEDDEENNPYDPELPGTTDQVGSRVFHDKLRCLQQISSRNRTLLTRQYGRASGQHGQCGKGGTRETRLRFDGAITLISTANDTQGDATEPATNLAK
jgi:hypothetical protein